MRRVTRYGTASMHLTPSELQALNHARYELSALQVQVQLLRMELLLKANFDPNQPRVPRGHHDGGQWTRVGADGSGDSAAARTGTDTTGVREPPPSIRHRDDHPPRRPQDRPRPERDRAVGGLFRDAPAERVGRGAHGRQSRRQRHPLAVLDDTGTDRLGREPHPHRGRRRTRDVPEPRARRRRSSTRTGEVIQVASWTESRAGDRAPDRMWIDFRRRRSRLWRRSPRPGLALFAWFASTATPDEAPVLAFRAREFRREQAAVVPLYVGQHQTRGGGACLRQNGGRSRMDEHRSRRSET